MNSYRNEDRNTLINQKVFFLAFYIVFSLYISLSFAAIATSRSIEYNERNDTKSYHAQFICEYSSGDKCYQYASEKFAWIFNGYLKTFSILSVFEFDGNFVFKLLLFSVALIVFLSITLFNFKFINNYWLLLPCFFLDPRLWELSANTLKQGLSFIFILLSFLFLTYQKSNISYFFKASAFFSHASGFVSFFIIKRKFGIQWFIASLIFVFYLKYIDFMSVLANFIGYGKLSFYLRVSEGDGSFISSFSILYLLVFIMALPIYLKRRKDIVFFASFNFIFACMMLGILASSVGIGYRFYLYLSPFIILLIDRVLDEVKLIFGMGSKFLLAFIFLSLYLYRFTNNFEMTSNHLSLLEIF